MLILDLLPLFFLAGLFLMLLGSFNLFLGIYRRFRNEKSTGFALGSILLCVGALLVWVAVQANAAV